jgi:hypothetical protein
VILAKNSTVLFVAIALVILAPSLVGQSLLLRNPGDVDRRHDFFANFPPKFIAAFKKFGEMDWKQRSSLYVSSTGFMFGAAGTKAGIPQSALMDLVSAANPTPADITLMESLHLEEQFAARKSALEKLLAEAQADAHLSRISREYTEVGEHSGWPKDKERIADSRWAEYRRQFDDLGLSEGIVRTDDHPAALFFISHAEGLSVAGSSCGYAFSKSPLEPVSEHPLEELARLRQTNSNSGVASVYRAMGDGWYTFYEIDWR